MQDEVLFRRQESILIRSIGCKVNFFSGPEGSFGLLAHPPDVVVLDGEEDKRMGIHLDKWLSSDFACSFGGLVVQDLTARGWWRFNGFLRIRRAGSIVSKFIPVIATDEVGDLAEGLVRDDVFKGHD